MKKHYAIEFHFEDINSYNQNLADHLINKPAETIPHVKSLKYNTIKINAIIFLSKFKILLSNQLLQYFL